MDFANPKSGAIGIWMGRSVESFLGRRTTYCIGLNVIRHLGNHKTGGILMDGNIQADASSTQSLDRYTVIICAAEARSVHVNLQTAGGDGFPLVLAVDVLDIKALLRSITAKVTAVM